MVASSGIKFKDLTCRASEGDRQDQKKAGDQKPGCVSSGQEDGT